MAQGIYKVYCRQAAPVSIICDQGKKFVNQGMLLTNLIAAILQPLTNLIAAILQPLNIPVHCIIPPICSMVVIWLAYKFLLTAERCPSEEFWCEDEDHYSLPPSVQWSWRTYQPNTEMVSFVFACKILNWIVEYMCSNTVIGCIIMILHCINFQITFKTDDS